MRSKPLRELMLPVETKDSKALPTVPAIFAYLWNSVALFLKSFTLCFLTPVSSFLMPLFSAAFSFSSIISIFSFSTEPKRFPGVSTSWLFMVSWLSCSTAPVTKPMSLWNMTTRLRSFCCGCSVCTITRRFTMNSPTSTSVKRLETRLPRTTRNVLPRYRNASYWPEIACFELCCCSITMTHVQMSSLCPPSIAVLCLPAFEGAEAGPAIISPSCWSVTWWHAWRATRSGMSHSSFA
mmetsp:Transcript_42743/g.133229  ORF Transcript_42743/g.133229 Transcript_42743/m.133229 type:complete len:237 (+) Transcript_42743:2445-3155(+)